MSFIDTHIGVVQRSTGSAAFFFLVVLLFFAVGAVGNGGVAVDVSSGALTFVLSFFVFLMA